LIELAKNTPDNQEYQEALKKYVNVLTSTNYIGYSVLYTALQSITDKKFTTSQAALISEYAPHNDFHSSLLKETATKGTIIENKVKDDLNYLNKIKSLK
jgi:hypothetical protein